MHPGPVPRTSTVLSWIIVILAAGACLVGLLWRDVYRDPDTFVDAGWIGNDIATLLFAVPALAWSTHLARSSSQAHLVWLGSLSFMFYNYAYYVFGAVPNRLLLVYIALTALSLLTLLLGLMSLRTPEHWTLARPVRAFLLTYMTLWAFFLGALWLTQAAAFAATGDPPDLNGSTHAFRVAAALDLILVVPFVALAVVLLARRSRWAVPVAVILNVKGVLYPLVLVASSISAAKAGVDGALFLVPLWIGFVVMSSVATFLLLRRFT